MKKGTSKAEKKQESRELETRCWIFLGPFLEELHKHVDRRLVKTLLDVVLVILMHRHRNNGLLLSELGDHLLGGERGPAGVKRIASLLHSARWKSDLILKYLWRRAKTRSLEGCTWKTLMGISYGVGCPQTLSAQNRHHCFPDPLAQ